MSFTSLPFLYPCLDQSFIHGRRVLAVAIKRTLTRRHLSTDSSPNSSSEESDARENSHLNPSPLDYGRNIFADKASVIVAAGSGGHGCVSFLREKFLDDGPPNGGDGGSGGNVYIQAIRGETSLHKLARQGFVRAGRGANGQGKSRNGKRGADVLIQVPVGTMVREISRVDPVAEEEENRRAKRVDSASEEVRGTWRRDKWILYPATRLSEYARTEFPPLPRARRTDAAAAQLPSPIRLDLSQPMERPMLLAAGAVGGLGNPHFVSRSIDKPKLATRGENGLSVRLDFELKLLADLGFVGTPNAGKSTLLRALSRSRARVGHWAFTTLQPNIGTMVLDDNHGRPFVRASRSDGEPRTHVSIADIPGLIKDAHLDRGLGLGFLRHVERAHVLAFVVDLSEGDAIESLKDLWRELGEFEKLKSMETNLSTELRTSDGYLVDASFGSSGLVDQSHMKGVGFERSRSSDDLPPLTLEPISSKPWFVVATKADLAKTQENFANLQAYLNALNQGAIEHPSGNRNAWKGKLVAIPVSAINGEGVNQIPAWTVELLEK